MSTSETAPPWTDAPPTYVPSQPQILVAPLPDAASFFWGRTVQGEVFVKGLGDRKGNRGVKTLTARLELTDSLPDHPTVVLHKFEDAKLYPPPSGKTAEFTSTSTSTSSSLPPAYADGHAQFSTSHRFSFPLPPSLPTSPASPIPGTLNLTAARRGEIKYTLVISLALSSGAVVEEVVPIEGTPQDVDVANTHETDGEGPEVEAKKEAEAVLERDGVRSRFVIETNTPRSGDLVRLGVEVKPMERQKTGVAGLSSQPNPTETLRPLRRVRVELFRRVRILDRDDTSRASSSSSTNDGGGGPEHLTLLFTTGKSLRFPGTHRTRPPLRVMFTLPTAQLGTVAGDTYGEITSSTTYHQTSFFVRVTIGFGDNHASSIAGPSTLSLPPVASGSGSGSKSGSAPHSASSTDAMRDWYIEQQVTIRPKLWVEPRRVIIHGGHLPASGLGTDIPLDLADLELDEATRAAYRAKGLDIVGDQGTYRAPEVGGAGPSGQSRTREEPEVESRDEPVAVEPHAADGEGGLPTFFESQAQVQSGEGPMLADGVQSERLVPVQFEQDDRATTVGRRGSLGGELGTWVEYDGYETFSVAPPPAAVSYGVDSSMDPPQEGDDDVNVVGGMVARLGLGEGGVVRPGAQAELMEQLGLGEGTRVVDLQDDLPPGIDEPSLPGLPSSYRPHTTRYSPPQLAPPLHTSTTPDTDNPPSFAASEAAQAVGGVASAQRSLRQTLAPSAPPLVGGGGTSEAPPGYFGASPGVGPPGAGLPPYSQG